MKEQMFDELVRGILALLPGQMERIVLYGSTARGTDGPESDIDVAVILKKIVIQPTLCANLH